MQDAAEAHIVADRSIWTGRVTALCGFTRESGEYDMHYFFPAGPLCPDCKRLHKEDR